MNEIFQEYGDDPIALFKKWLDEAIPQEINDPEAICIASADAQGRPSARMVLLKEVSDKGFKFHTNADSRKGREFAENQHVAFCMYWKSTRKQIRVEGTIAQVTNDESDEYFETRPIERQIGAWASKQSQPYTNRAELAGSLEKYREEFSGTDNIPRPPYWKGYRITPTAIEFWIGNQHRLHERFVYTKGTDGWDATWLYP